MSTAEFEMDIERIFHPTDFSEASLRAFAHALRLAVDAKSSLTIYHTEPHNRSASWEQFPHVRQVLEGWGMIPPHSSREAIVELGIGVEKVSAAHRNARESVLRYLEKYPHELIVLATHQHTGLRRWFSRSVAEPIARRSGEMTLFIPTRSAGFVSFRTGTVTLRHILIPIDISPYPRLAIDAAVALVRSLRVTGVTFHLLLTHGKGRHQVIERREDEIGKWITISDDRDPLTAILRCAAGVEADLIIAASGAGPSGIAGRITGRLTERVIRRATCPVLTVPPTPAFDDSMAGFVSG